MRSKCTSGFIAAFSSPRPASSNPISTKPNRIHDIKVFRSLSNQEQKVLWNQYRQMLQNLINILSSFSRNSRNLKIRKISLTVSFFLPLGVICFLIRSKNPRSEIVYFVSIQSKNRRFDASFLTMYLKQRRAFIDWSDCVWAVNVDVQTAKISKPERQTAA